MAFSALIQFREKRVNGRKVMEVVIPRRVFTFLRAALPHSVQLVFEKGKPPVRIDSKEFAALVEKSMKKGV